MADRRGASDQLLDRAETIFSLSNGYVGIRGTFDEGRPSFDPGTFVNGFHETWPIVYAEEAYGLARTGQTIVNVPDATVLRLYVDDEPLYVPTARLREYSRVLDMRDGSARELVWTTAAGKHVAVRSCRLVSLEHRHLVAIAYEVTVDRACPIASVAHVNREDRPPSATHRPGPRARRPARAPRARRPGRRGARRAAAPGLPHHPQPDDPRASASTT